MKSFESKELTVADLKRIVQEQFGSLTESDIDLLKKGAPNLVLCVKVGYGPRFLTTAAKLDADVESNIEYYRNYKIDQCVKDVFIPASDLDLLKKVLGL